MCIYRILTHDIAYVDETTYQVLKEPNKGVQAKKFMWLFAGGPPEEFVYYYQHHPSRSTDVPLQFFEDFAGFLHCDGYPGYDTLAKRRTDITLVGCLYHGRRKFVEVTKIMPNKEGVATHLISQIAKLACIEEEIKNTSLEAKQIAREMQVKSLLNELHHYLVTQQPNIPPKSFLGKQSVTH